MHKKILRNPDTLLPDGFHGFPAGVCPWCSGEPNKHDKLRRGEEGCHPKWYIRHGRKCPRVKALEFNEFGGICKLELGPPYKDMRDL